MVIALILGATDVTNRRTIAIIRPSGCPSVCLSVCLGQACIVIIQCTLVRIYVYGLIIQCSGHSDTKACPPTRNCLLQFHLEDRYSMDVQARTRGKN